MHATVQDQIKRSNISPSQVLNVYHCALHLKKFDCTVSDCLNSFSLTFLHLNIQSLRGKLDELNVFLHDVSALILCLNEHWLNKLEANLYVPQDYTLIDIYCRTESNYGGTAIYFRSNLVYDVEILNLAPICESRVFEVVGVRLVNFRVIVVSLYSVPDTNIEIFVNKLELLYNLLKSFYRYKIVILGDININVLDKNSVKLRKLNGMLSSLNWSFFNNLPTRGRACLDNVITSSQESRLACGTIASGLSDHQNSVWAILTLMKSEISSSPKTQKHIEFRNLCIKNIMNFRSYLHSVNFNFLQNRKFNFDIDKNWKFLLDQILIGLQTYCPLKRHLIKKLRHKCSWFTNGLYELRNSIFFWYTQAKLGLQNAEVTYRKLKKLYRQEIKKAKLNHNDNLIMKAKNNNKTFGLL